MAVKIDIPGVGEVTADNAASEETLLAILAAVDNTSNTAKSRAKDEKDANKAQSDNTKQLRDSTKAGKEFKVGWNAAADGFVNAMKTFSLTAISMATKFATNYAEIAADPIKSTSESLNQLIDSVANVATSFTDAIPFIGQFVSAIINAGAELAKVANTTFANQLKKNIEALQQYAKVGTSFAGGMMQMQATAITAGMGIEQFSSVIAKNRDLLQKTGLAGSDVATRLANAMGYAADKTRLVGKSGENLRTEMFKMGYTYEEQGEIFAGYMANQQAAGKLRAMTDKEIAIGTRNYARDLKVISDITGQDAKKLMDRSRAESMRGALANKLQGDQKKAFMEASAVLTSKSKEAGAALTQYLTFGNITDPTIAANKEMSEMVRAVGDQVKAGNADMINITQKEMVRASTSLTKDANGFSSAVDTALVAGVTGPASNIAGVLNEFMSAMAGAADPAMAKKSKDSAEAMALAQDDLTKQTAALYDQTQQNAVQMEQLVNPALGKYAALLTEVNQLTQGGFMDFLRFVANGGKTDTRVTVEKMLSDLNPFNSDNWKVRKPVEDKNSPAGAKPKNPFDTATPSSPVFAFANGGSIPAGKVGMAGEKGPELIAGPAEVLSTKSTEKLMQSVDMLASAKESASTTKDGVSVARLDEVIKQLMELVRLMRDNVSHTAKVAQNTN